MKKLVNLDIRSTDIDSGLEYLPENVKKIHCDSLKEDSSCWKIQNQLKDYAFYRQEVSVYGYNYRSYDYQAWRKDNQKLIAKVQQEDSVSPTQKWLDSTYSKKERISMKQLLISDENLTGHLDLTDFINLEEINITLTQITSLNLVSLNKLNKLRCSLNKLFDIDLTLCSNIAEFYCHGNYLNSLDFLASLDSKKLRKLSIRSNNFSLSDLSPFGRFVNLEYLGLGNDWYEESVEKINRGIYNHFVGSLRPLQKMSNLRELDISNTDIDSGLECLPESIKYFECLANVRENAKIELIEQELKKFGEPKWEREKKIFNFSHLLPYWKKIILKKWNLSNSRILVILSLKKAPKNIKLANNNPKSFNPRHGRQINNPYHCFFPYFSKP